MLISNVAFSHQFMGFYKYACPDSKEKIVSWYPFLQVNVSENDVSRYALLRISKVKGIEVLSIYGKKMFSDEEKSFIACGPKSSV